MLTNEPCSHPNSIIMNNCDENIESANAKPKLLTRIFKCFKRGSKSKDNISSNGTLISKSNEMPIDLPILDQDFSNIEHFNDNTINNSDEKQKSKRNSILKLFRCV
uniref:Uncharacterized protein n=2 Tax=Schizaphis graminum TaxID=13262 RepID=A0A2S2NGG2_SCHGA